MSFQYLSPPQLDGLFDSLTSTGMLTSKTLDSFVSGINPFFAGNLPDDGPPTLRLLQTLSLINRVERLNDGTVPFALWLANAEKVTRQLPQGKVVSQMLAVVSTASLGLPPVT